MYTLETQALISNSRLSDFWEQRLKPENVNDRERYLADEEDGEYWRQVFGTSEFIVEPELINEPF